MSFWDDVATAGKFVKHGFENPLGLAFGLALTADDNVDVGDMAKAFAEAPVPRPDISLLAVPADRTARGISAAFQVSNAQGVYDDARDGRSFDPNAPQGQVFSKQTWADAWRRSEHISPFQAAMIWAGTKPENVNFGDSEESVKARSDFFYHTWYGRTASGVGDAAITWFADPLIVGGKIAKAGEIASVTAKAVHVPGAVRSLVNPETATQLSKGEQKTATKLSEWLRSTDSMNYDDMMRDGVLRDTPDAGAVASMLEVANRIDDPTRRLAVKADIWGVIRGNPESLSRAKAWDESLQAAMQRFLRPAEGSNGSVLFRVDDFGEMEIKWLNDEVQAKEILARQDAIREEAARLDRLWNIKNTTDRLGNTMGDSVRGNVARRAMRESVLVDGQGSRVIRVIHGVVGDKVPNHVDTSDAARGYEDFTGQLIKDRWLTGEQRGALIRDFANAATEEQRAKVVWHAENLMYQAAGEKYGLTPQEIRALYSVTTGVRKKWRKALEERAYSAINGDPATIIGPDGEALAFTGPWIQSQIGKMVPFTDPDALDWLLKKNSQTRWLESALRGAATRTGAAKINNGVENLADFSSQLISTLMTPWKFMALFRLAYPVRVQVDTQLRNVSALGAIQYGLSAKEGTMNLARNWLQRGESPDYALKMADLMQREDEVLRKLKALDKNPGKNPEARRAELSRQLRQIRSERAAAPTTMARLLGQPGTVRRGKSVDRASLLRKDETFGMDADGNPINIAPARNANEYAVIARTLSGDGTARALTAKTVDDVTRNQQYPGWDIINGADPNWDPSMLRDVNQQFRNSKSFMKVLSEPDDVKVIDWVKANPEEWRLFDHIWTTPEAYVRMIRQNIAHYLPSEEVQQIVRMRDLTMADLKAHFPHAADKPNIHGANYRYGWPNDPNAPGNVWRSFRDWWFKWASDVPEEVMGRHPLYNARFRERMRSQIDGMPQEFLTLKDIEQMRRNAATMARRDVRDTLFDLTRVSGGADSMRLFSPFYSAWEDTMKKWGHLFYENPQHAIRFYQAWRFPDQMGWVVDSNGNTVQNGKAYDRLGGKEVTGSAKGKGEYIIIPNIFAPVGLGKKDWGLRIPKGSFNIVFQGETPFLPGAGPLVAVPLNEVAKRTSLVKQVESNPVLSWLLPYGITEKNPAEQLLPAWVKRLVEMRPTSQDYAEQFVKFGAAEDAKWRNGQRDTRPSNVEIGNMTNNYFVMRAILSNAAPVTVVPGISPKLQVYVDQAHMLRNEYYSDPTKFRAAHSDKDWQEVFYDKWPDYYALTISLSSNDTGIIASDQAYDASKRYASVIADSPQDGWAIVGAENAGAFDPNVRTAQLANSIGYGQTKRWRSNTNPVDALRQIEVERGYIKYNAFMTMINMRLEERDPTGRRNLQSKGNEDLKALKTQYVEALANENRAWGEAFVAPKMGGTNRFLIAMQNAWDKSPSLKQRPDMVQLQKWIRARGMVREALQRRETHGISNPKNQDIAAWWTAYQSALVRENIGFERMYNRELEHDDMNKELLGIGTQG